jgi:hypothetical protein
MAYNDDLNRAGGTTASGLTGGASDWASEENYWRTAYSSRPYAQSDRSFEHYRGGYRYGTEAANRYRGRAWNDVESDLRSGWDKYEHRGQSKWEDIKDSVRDAWDRVTGKR